MLEKLFIRYTEDTPEITLDKEENKFEFSGNSLPDNSIEFYAPIIAWIAEYVLSPNDETIFEFKMDYFNSSSARVFIELFHELETLHNQNKKVKVLWYYQKDDYLIEEKGMELQSIVNIPFELIETENKS